MGAAAQLYRLAVLAAAAAVLHAQDAGLEPVSTEQPATVAAIALSIRSRAIQDSRCYLMNGGAVESFFVGEDTPVGSVIGVLSVNGDPGPDGDITLSLAERDAAVGIGAGSKNLTLTKALDREARAALYVNVRCARRGSPEPSFLVPVWVRVRDVNDNAPQWQRAPYAVSLSELTAPGSRLLPAAAAVDRDQPGPHATIHYSVVQGPYSDYFEFPNELESALVLKRALDYESVNNFSVTLRASDGGRPPLHADAELAVTVLDADDQNPVFSAQHYTVDVGDGAKKGTELVPSGGRIRAWDQDLGIAAPLRYALQGGAGLRLEPDHARLYADTDIMPHDLPLTVVIKATQVDNPDRYALATVGISSSSRVPVGAASGLSAPSGVRFTRDHFTATVREDTAPPATLTTLTTRTNDNQKPSLQFFVSDRSFLEHFALNSLGELLLRRPVDYEQRPHYHYQVMVSDGAENDTASLSIEVVNVNEWEPRFKHPQYELTAPPPSAPSTPSTPDEDGLPLGQLEVHDGDNGDNVTVTLHGPDANWLSVHPVGGGRTRWQVSLRGRAARGGGLLRATATASDSGDPPRQSSVPLLVHVPVSEGGLAARAAAGAGAALLLIIAAIGLLTWKRRSKRSSSVDPVKVAGPLQGAGLSGVSGGGAVSGGGGLAAAPSGSLLSVSAGASTILAASNSSLDVREHANNNNNVSGRSPRRPAGALLSDHLQEGVGRSGVAWPAGTIPARVKKLSWDDGDKAQPPPPGGVHEANNAALGDHMNLTVYF